MSEFIRCAIRNIDTLHLVDCGKQILNGIRDDVSRPSVLVICALCGNPCDHVGFDEPPVLSQAHARNAML